MYTTVLHLVKRIMQFRQSLKISILAVVLAAFHVRAESSASCFAQFDYLLEKTMLKVDVLRLLLSVDERTAGRVATVVKGKERNRELEQSVVAQYLQAATASVKMSFQMGISYDRFVGSAEKTSKNLAKQGFLDKAAADMVTRDMAARFAFLQDRGIQEGDHLYYALRADSVRSRFVTVEGDTLLNDLRVGPERRIMLLGSYFAPKTNFHDGLLDQVFQGCEEQ